MSNNAEDKHLRITKKTHDILTEIKYKTRTRGGFRNLMEEAVVDLRVKRLKKGKKS